MLTWLKHWLGEEDITDEHVSVMEAFYEGVTGEALPRSKECPVAKHIKTFGTVTRVLPGVRDDN